MKKKSSLVQMQCLLGVLLNFPRKSFLFPIPAVQLRAARSANHFYGFSFISCPPTPGATPKVGVLEAKHSVVCSVSKGHVPDTRLLVNVLSQVEDVIIEKVCRWFLRCAHFRV